MHIKAFLKKISQIPAVDISNPYKNITTQKHSPERKTVSNLGHISDKMGASILKKQSTAITYLNNHNPTIKSRITHKQDHSYAPESAVRDSKFRARIQDKLMDLMNQRKELIVTHVRFKRQSSGSLYYSASKEKNSQKYQKKMPEYVQNIMKPCRVSSMAIGKRPITGRLTPSKSQPKIYCKPLLPTSRQKMRVSTVDFSANHNRRSMTRPKEQLLEEKKLQMLTQGRVDGWNRSKHNEEDDQIWLK